MEIRDQLGRFAPGSANHLIHGHASGKKSREYRVWAGMKTRCYNKRHKDYPKYGGRGIRLCDEWLCSFETFLADMGPIPNPIYQIDRINVNGNYEPGNCRWVDYKTQANNKQNSVRIHIRDRSYTVEEICIRYDLERDIIKNYVVRQKKKGLIVTYTEAFFYACLKKGIQL